MSTEATESAISSSPPRFGGLAIVLGVLTAVLGILVMVWPGQTLLIIALLFGLQLLFVGAFRIMVAVTTKAAPGWWRGLVGVLGGLTVIAGIICFIRPGTSLLVIAILIAAGWLVDGVTSIVSGVVDNWPGLQRVAQIVFGVVSILAAIVVVIWPSTSLLLMTTVGGVLLLVLGVAIIVVAVVVRRSTNRPARAA